MTVNTATSRAAETSVPLLPALAERWSPRSFDPAETIDERKLIAAIEAARWSPSAGNSQPWRFIVARRGSDAFTRITGTLTGTNSLWAGTAGALVVALHETTDARGQVRPWGEYDLGQAMAHFSVQAHVEGLHVHTMGGFDAAALTAAFDLPDELRPLTVTAVGTLAPAEHLADEVLIARESAPRIRLPLEEIVLLDA